MSSSSGSTSYDPMEELTAVSNAFVAEFGGDTFTLKGDRATNDADVIKRFEKVASAYKMKDGVVGYLDVKVYRGDALLSTYRIENHAYTYDLCIDDFSDDLDITVMNAVYAQLKAGMPMQRDETEFVLYAANETLADATAKSLYEAQIPLVKLSDDWSDSDFLTVELDRLVDKENLVVVDSHTFKK
ncbi:MAG: hypothetical protein LBN24_03835 [Mediterranea sp.]|nr:hypothetical protein [Mediterranea sp.]